MKINQKIDFVEGAFDTETGELICVEKHKYGEVTLCFKENMNIPFARIKLHSKNSLGAAKAVMEDAYQLGEEICRRWNSQKKIQSNAFRNRLKFKESTLCTFTVNGAEIHEGDILGFGDNYPMVVLYNPFEGQFKAVEFGNNDTGSIYREHDILCSTSKHQILGNIDDDFHLLKNAPKDFDYTADLKQYYQS